MASVGPSTFTSPIDVPDATRSQLDAVEKQFDISDDRLLAITKRFLDEVTEGLSHYGKPMAMM